jgi:hypothetical protein
MSDSANIQKTITTKDDYYYCPRCNKNNFENINSVPCLRGSCEARIDGNIITTKSVIIEDLSEEQIEWNKNNSR